MGDAVPGIHRGFRDVDAEDRAQDFAVYLRDVGAQMALEKTAMRDLLAPSIGQRLLDVGCGVGDDVRALAGRVAPTGTVVGVDMSASMVDQARSRNSGLGIEFHVADAHALPFPDHSFDAARTERTLQHVESPADVLAEMTRVVRPGGLLTASEPDWGTLAVDGSDHLATREVVQEISENHIRHGWIGRQLHGHFARLGLDDIEVYPVTLVLRSFTTASQILGLSEVATTQWLDEMRERDARGQFFAAVTGFTVKGRHTSGNHSPKGY